MKKHNKKELGLTALMLIGTAGAVAAVFAMALLLALFSSFTEDPTSLTGAFSLLALLLAGAVSGFVTSKLCGDGGALIGSLSAVIAGCLMIITGLIWMKGALPFGVVINMLAFIGVSVVAAVIGRKLTRRKRRKYYRG